MSLQLQVYLLWVVVIALTFMQFFVIGMMNKIANILERIKKQTKKW